jgi:hypothetical protein
MLKRANIKKTKALLVLKHQQGATKGRSLKSESGKILPYFRAKARKVKCGVIVVRVKKSKSLAVSPIKTASFNASNVCVAARRSLNRNP